MCDAPHAPQLMLWAQLWGMHTSTAKQIMGCSVTYCAKIWFNTVLCRRRVNSILQRSSSYQMRISCGPESWLPCRQQSKSFGKHHCSMRFSCIVMFSKAQPFRLLSGLDMITKPWTCCQQQFKSSVKRHCSMICSCIAMLNQLLWLIVIVSMTICCTVKYA